MSDCVGSIQYECGTVRPVDPTVTLESPVAIALRSRECNVIVHGHRSNLPPKMV